jgi:hypothetical protein
VSSPVAVATTGAGLLEPQAPIIDSVTISGDTRVGNVLSSSIAYTQAPYPAGTPSYQWQRDAADISGATGSSYTLTADDADTAITLIFSITNSEGSDGPDTSNTINTDALSAPGITGVPTISGTAYEGNVLTATAASPVTGNPPPDTTWQWERDGTPIGGATSSTYTVVSADNNTDLTVVQTEANTQSPDATAESAATTVQADPVISGSPTISGTETVGSTLTATAASVTGTPTPTRTWQWQRSANGTTGWTDISGATASTYTLVSADEDNYVRVSQIETNNAGGSTRADSAESAASGQIGPEVTDAYAANSISPDLVADFAGTLNSGTPFYRKQGTTCELADFGFPEPSGLRTLTNASGNIVWTAHNLAVNSETPATQSITVVSGGEYTVEMEGAGSFALTGAGTGTASDGSPATITASTTTLTITLTGAADRVWVYRSDLGGMDDVEASYRTAGAPANYLATTGTARYLPRFGNHKLSGSAWVPAGALVEREARTNLCTASSDLTDGTEWLKGGVTITANQGVGPDGDTSLDQVNVSSGNSSHSFGINAGISISSVGNTVLFSVFSRYTNHKYWSLRYYDNENAWAAVTFDIEGAAVTDEQVGATSGTVHGRGVIDLGGGLLFLWVAASANNRRAVTPILEAVDVAAPTRNTNGAVQWLAAGTETGQFGFVDINDNASTPASHVPTTGTATARTADPALTIAAADAPYSASGLSLAVIGDVTYADNNTTEATLYQRQDQVTAIPTYELRIATNISGTPDQGTLDAIYRNSVDGFTRDRLDYTTAGVNQPFSVAVRYGTSETEVAGGGTATGSPAAHSGLEDPAGEDLKIAAFSFMGNIARVVGWAEDVGVGIEQASTEDNTTP